MVEPIDALLDRAAPDAHLERTTVRLELLRFGRSQVTYQHSEERTVLRMRLQRNGREAWGSTTDGSPKAVAELRDRLEAHARAMPPGDPLPVMRAAGEAPRLPTYFSATDLASAEDRVSLMLAVQAAMPRGTMVGGSVTNAAEEVEVATSAGLRRREHRTRAAVVAVGEREGRSTYMRTVSRDIDALDLPSVASRAAALIARVDDGRVTPGRFRVLLWPQAVITMLATLGHIGLGGRAYGSGESPFAGRMGEPVAAGHLTVADDAADSRGLATGFDAEGAVKHRVPLIEDGRLVGVVHDVRSADRAGTESSGHAVPPGWRFGAGPSPSHLVMSPGALSDEALLSALGNGIAVQRVDYVRVVQPRQGIVTGSTRDATMLVRNGRVTARLPALRFTIALPELFRAVEAIGFRRETGDTVFMESVVAPGMVVGEFPIDAVAHA